MKQFLKPNKQRVAWFFIIIMMLIVITVLSFSINEREIAGVFLLPLFSLPIVLFDAITGSLFAPNDCGFFCFPTIPQLIFVLVFDTALIYIVACLIVFLKGKRKLYANTEQ